MIQNVVASRQIELRQQRDDHDANIEFCQAEIARREVEKRIIDAELRAIDLLLDAIAAEPPKVDKPKRERRDLRALTLMRIAEFPGIGLLDLATAIGNCRVPQIESVLAHHEAAGRISSVGGKWYLSDRLDPDAAAAE